MCVLIKRRGKKKDTLPILYVPIRYAPIAPVHKTSIVVSYLNIMLTIKLLMCLFFCFRPNIFSCPTEPSCVFSLRRPFVFDRILSRVPTTREVYKYKFTKPDRRSLFTCEVFWEFFAYLHTHTHYRDFYTRSQWVKFFFKTIVGCSINVCEFVLFIYRSSIDRRMSVRERNGKVFRRDTTYDFDAQRWWSKI